MRLASCSNRWRTVASMRACPASVSRTETARRDAQERKAALIGATHNGRAGQPGDIAETAYFLASDGARHITGQTLHVNGGAHTTR
jgi:3-oxoacyl-[acyl-carrier protein] reductase